MQVIWGCQIQRRDRQSSAAKEFEGFARDCVRLAERADTPELREKLLNLAREWMHAVMDDEDAESAAQSRRPMASALRRDRRSQAARPLARRRTVTKRRPYEPRIVGGKVVILPADLQRLHQRLLNSAVIEVSDEMLRRR